VGFSIFKVKDECFLRWSTSIGNCILSTYSWEAMSIVSISVEAVCHESLEELEMVSEVFFVFDAD